MKHEDAITKLEDYGYSYYFAQRILQDARDRGSWDSWMGDVTVTYTCESLDYEVKGPEAWRKF